MRDFFESKTGVIIQFLIFALAYILLGDFIHQADNGFLFYVKIVFFVAIVLGLLILFCVCSDVVFGKKERPKWVKTLSSAYMILCIVSVIVLCVASSF